MKPKSMTALWHCLKVTTRKQNLCSLLKKIGEPEGTNISIKFGYNRYIRLGWFLYSWLKCHNFARILYAL